MKGGGWDAILRGRRDGEKRGVRPPKVGGKEEPLSHIILTGRVISSAGYLLNPSSNEKLSLQFMIKGNERTNGR